MTVLCLFWARWTLFHFTYIIDVTFGAIIFPRETTKGSRTIYNTNRSIALITFVILRWETFFIRN